MCETFDAFQTFTESELRAARLLRKAQADGYLQPFPLGQPPSSNDPSGDRACLARARMFRLGRDLAPEFARSLVWNVIDATRLDDEQTNDAFVQTTIYIIASLAEPLTSALMWPVLRQILAQLGRRRIARVTGLLATGSFAQGRSRLVEEAATMQH